MSALEAPDIREVALGGPDTATRARRSRRSGVAAARVEPVRLTCGSTIGAWDELVHEPRPRLAARAEPQLAAASLCEIAATAGYRRLENQLYRVEVHDGGVIPTFKWSRENGSVAYAVESLSIDAGLQQTTIRLAARGRDANLDLAVHDRVELVDDDAELVNRAGTFFDYLNDGNDALELVLAGVPAGTLGQDPARHPILRRWDHRPGVAGANLLPIVEGVWIELEEGVQVRFAPGGQYHSGDYWQIPARTISADVEWPRNDDGDPIARPPAGIAHAYCRLGIVEVAADGVITVAADCRDRFPPLTAMEQLPYVSGDGQEAAPNALVPQPLAVRVARGLVPIAGRTIRFEIDTGGGTVGAGASVLEVATDADGLAGCDWHLGAAATGPARFQRVRASLLDPDGQAFPGQIVVFCATATVPVQPSQGSRGCDVTIGPGGDFERLSAEILRQLLERGRGRACICFLPGVHDLPQLEIDGNSQFLLSLHGCGHASRLNLRGPLTFNAFASIEVRDLVMQAEGDTGLVFQKNDEMRLANVRLDRVGEGVRSAAVNVVSGRTVSITGCEILATLPSMALMIQDIQSICRVTQNRFVGVVSFYGETTAIPGAALVRRLAARTNLRLTPGGAQLTFSDNEVSLLSIATALATRLGTATGTANGLFTTAVLHGNTFVEPNNVFAAGLLGFATNVFVAQPPADSLYGVMLALRATAAGNLAVAREDRALLAFVVPDPGSFAKAANVVDIQP